MHTAWRHLRFAFATLAVMPLLAVRTAAAQAILGTVVDGTSHQPVPGAVVSAFDTAGTMLGRSLSSEHGVFRIAVGGSHRASSLKVLRIGYSPVTQALPAVRDSTPLVITLQHIATQIEAMRVVDTKTCGDDRGAADALTLWEQARAALLATIVARESNPANAVSVVYTRFVSVRDQRVLSQHTQRRVGMTTQPFKARATPAQFAQVGYVDVHADGSRVFSAPDAEILLDPAFAATHCFNVTRERTDAGTPRVGLGFRPVDRKRDITDIEGTLWFTAAPLALDALDFTYTAPTDVSDSLRANGELHFRTVANGASFIENWLIRIPTAIEQGDHSSVAMDRSGGQQIGGVRRSTEREQHVTQVEDVGGRVVSATWPDGVRIGESLGSIAGTVLRAESKKAAADVVVTLAADQQTVRTDSLGAFHFADLLPGRYALSIQDTAYQAFIKRPADTVSVLVKDGVPSDVRATIAVADSALVRLCPDRARAKKSTMLVGQVHSPAFSPTWKLTATWQADYNIVDKRGGAGIVAGSATIEPDSLGNYYVCGAVRERPIHLGIWQGTLQLLDTAVIVEDSTIKRVDLNLWMNVRPAAPPPKQSPPPSSPTPVVVARSRVRIH